MSFESYFWRKTLKRDASYLAKKMELGHDSIEDERFDEYASNVEIKIMTSCFSIRKLSDSGKLPDAVLSQTIQLTSYPRKDEAGPRPYPDPVRDYELDQPASAELSLREVCNQVIHSHILECFGDDKKLFSSFCFVSDRDKDIRLYEWKLDDFLKCIHEVAESYVTKVEATYKEESGKWVYKRS